MKSSKPTPINLPYASAVASWSSDQGGNSFLGSFFKKGVVRPGAGTVTNKYSGGQPATTPLPAIGGGLFK